MEVKSALSGGQTFDDIIANFTAQTQFFEFFFGDQ